MHGGMLFRIPGVLEARLRAPGPGRSVLLHTAITVSRIFLETLDGKVSTVLTKIQGLLFSCGLLKFDGQNFQPIKFRLTNYSRWILE